MSAEQIAKALAEQDARLASIGGCSDGHCVIIRPQGMHTNGGCHCWMDKMRMQRFAHASNAFASDIRRILQENTK